MSDELKACPFCGGEAEIERVGTARMSTIYFCTECSCRLETGETFNHGALWNRRAQLPRQGGEAVGEVRALSDGKQYAALYTMVGQHLVGEKLYTHPADQVEDDLTMVKVSRELLQDMRDLAFDQVEHHRAAMGAYKQTRQSAMDSVLAQADALLNGGRS